MFRSHRPSVWGRLSLVAGLVSTLAVPVHAATSHLVHGGFLYPTVIRFAPDGRLFVCELASGSVYTFATAFEPERRLWADLPVYAAGERGLLGMAFHPQFPDSAWVYFFHSHADPLENRLVRMRDAGGIGVDYQILLTLPSVSQFHHGGRLAFGGDGMLYVTYGDQQEPSAARVPHDVRGKLLRLTPLGEPAPGNMLGGAHYARGIRNAFGLCFDPARPLRAYFTENGPDCDDEVNGLWAGADYGWGANDPCDADGPGTTSPALARFSPTIAPTGCVVYRGGPDPEHEGALFFGSFNDGRIRRITFDPEGVVIGIDELIDAGDAVLDVIQGPDGRLWYSATESIHRVTSDALAAPAPDALAPLAAWPNPSRGAVSFRLAAPGAQVALAVFDVRGRRVRSLEAFDGIARWDGRDEGGAPVPAGIYLARLTTRTGVHTVRIVRLGS